MRKNILYILLTIIMIGTFSCEEKDWSYSDGNFVAFESKIVKGVEGTSSLAINLLCADAGRNNPVTVTFEYTVESTDVVDGEDFVILNATNTVTFEPKQGVASIDVQLSTDLLMDEATETVTFAITAVDQPGYNIGLIGPDAVQSTCKMEIINACNLVAGIFEGDVVGAETPVGQTWWVDYETDFTWELVEEVEPGLLIFNVTGFWAAQLEYWEEKYSNCAPFTYYPVKVTIDARDPANARYSIEETKCATCSYGDYSTKAVDNQPVTIDVCNKYVEIPYTVLGTSWAHGYMFNVKFQFE